ncbi:hypothetical protein XH98_37885 [Bradyrhizobium sp. CCBAU 51745]|nr:hypothetical protein [Bradyrhizobium sp. CCBAU 51745]
MRGITNLNDDTEAAVQYLVWTLEETEMIGSRDAADYAHLAIDALRKRRPRRAKELSLRSDPS